jgi:Type III restriction enzyme, res subunit
VSDVKLAQFQEAAVRHIVNRIRDGNGSRRMLLADEVGLGKTIVAQGVIQALLKGRRRPLTVIYLCSNAEIAEQNRTKLDPDAAKPIGRVTELALAPHSSGSDLLLYSFTPGTSLKEGTGLAWERRLLLYLLHRIYGFPVGTKVWKEFFRCGAREENWHGKTSLTALCGEFGRLSSVAFQAELAIEWRACRVEQGLAIAAVRDGVSTFDPRDPEARTHRNTLVASLRGVMQRVALRHLKPDLVILDEVQRFRDVLDEANNSQHIAADLFSRRVPVLILSATPYRALTLAHEAEDDGPDHHKDFVKTLTFLFDKDGTTPERIQRNLSRFGERLKNADSAQRLDDELLKLKHALEADLTKVICRTERNWYVLDRKKGVDDGGIDSGSMPGKGELEEFFRLHNALAPSVGMGHVTEFWKSAPSLLTFLDSRYHIFRTLRDDKTKVPRALLTPPSQVKTLATRNHRISKLVDVALGKDGTPPRLWTAPTYTYYRDDCFGEWKPHKVLVFSGWRFVPKTVAIVTSRVATDRFVGDLDDTSQPFRFTEKGSYHVFDVCFPSPALATIGHEALLAVRQGEQPRAHDVIQAAERLLRRQFRTLGVEVVKAGGQRPWQIAMRLEQHQGRSRPILDALEACADEQEDGAAAHLRQHAETIAEWLRASRTRLQISEAHLSRLALIASFSPAVSVLRACDSVYGDAVTGSALSSVATLCLGPMRRYFNRPHVQQVIRHHRFLMRGRLVPAEDGGYTERALVYAGDAHLQAVLDEYVYLLRHAGQADTLEKALDQIGEVWTLSRGNPRTNGPKGNGAKVHVDENAEVHATHFGLAFGEDISRDAGQDEDDEKLRKSVVREAFNSPFWPFVLATTSVGQEGLDFHLYCRDVLHWNLPSNPVDLEQREGRINRRDCLAVRESIANDWPLADRAIWGNGQQSVRNPWTVLFEKVENHDDHQKYKHGLYPHWVYECRDPQKTVRIRRHVPFFSTSRDAAKYERLKTGLALYRLVFGQMNQEDLLGNLQQQLQTLSAVEQDRAFRRLTSYMLNLSPIGHQHALEHAQEEADRLLAEHPKSNGLRKLLQDVVRLQVERPDELAEVERELTSLVAFAEQALAKGGVESRTLRKIVTALAYLRNPYDRIFDLHVEGGFADDIAEIRKAFAALL